MDKKLKIPAFYDDEYLDKIIELNKNSKNRTTVSELFGSFPNISHSQTRINALLSQPNMQLIQLYIEKARENNIDFDYIMNGTCYGNLTINELKHMFTNEIETVRSIGIKKITASTPYLIQFIRKFYPDMYVTASINLCTNSAAQAKRWCDMGINKIVLDRSINRNGRLIKNILSSCDAEIELLVNSMCLCFCGMHQFHNNINSHINGDSDKFFCYNYPYASCFSTYLRNPIEMICSGWIRPEDLDGYSKLGVHNFKLEGRGEDRNLVFSIIEAYMNNKYEGNIFDLLFTGYKTKKRVEAYLDNMEMSDFFDKVVLSEINCANCGGENAYCKTLAEKISFNEEKLEVMLDYIEELNDCVVGNKTLPEKWPQYIIL